MKNAPRILATAQLTNAIGDGAFLVCSVLYFTTIIGLSATQVGFGLTIGWACGSVAGVFLGQLADRRGPRGVAVLLALSTSVAVGTFLFVASFPMFVLAAILYGVCQSSLSAVRQALLAGLVPPAERTRVRAFLQSTFNAGLAVGAAIGGLALQSGSSSAYKMVFAMDVVCFLAAALVLSRLPAVAGVPKREGEPKLAVLKDRRYALITGLNTVLLLYMPLLSLVLPLWIVLRTDAPRWMVSALLVLNTISVVLFQVRVARRVNGLPTASRTVAQSGVVMLAACVVFALSGLGKGVWVAGAILIAGALLQVVAEMMQASGMWEISFGLAPADKQGQYQGFFGISTAVARMLGPLLLTSLIITLGTPGWLILGAMFLLAGLVVGPVVRYEFGREPVTVLR